jgi:5-methylcytosine-specific restriction endonuclease McrA
MGCQLIASDCCDRAGTSSDRRPGKHSRWASLQGTLMAKKKAAPKKASKKPPKVRVKKPAPKKSAKKSAGVSHDRLMTESQWLKCGNPTLMLTFIHDHASDRKRRLWLIPENLQHSSGRIIPVAGLGSWTSL